MPSYGMNDPSNQSHMGSVPNYQELHKLHAGKAESQANKIQVINQRLNDLTSRKTTNIFSKCILALRVNWQKHLLRGNIKQFHKWEGKSQNDATDSLGDHARDLDNMKNYLTFKEKGSLNSTWKNWFNELSDEKKQILIRQAALDKQRIEVNNIFDRFI